MAAACFVLNLLKRVTGVAEAGACAAAVPFDGQCLVSKHVKSIIEVADNLEPLL